LSLKINETKVRIRYGETDQMGIVYYGNYAQFLEVGRVEWLRNLGISYRWMEEQGIMLPVVSMSLHFKKPAKYDDVLVIKTMLKKAPSIKIEFDYEVYIEGQNECITTGNTVLAFIAIKTKRPLRCPDFILERLAGIKF
jgi:acyl-CoA thioester hydrolase